MIQHTFRAMGTTIVLVGPDADLLHQGRRRLEEIEAACTRFDPTSDLSRLNRMPPGHAEVSGDLLAVLALAEDLRDRTNGVFDPAVGDRVVQWGYDTTFSEVSDRAAPPRPSRGGVWTVVDGGVVRDAGVRFDVGGIAKGWACDQIVEAGLAVIASAGGDMRSSSPDAIAELADPVDGHVVARIDVGVGAVATSTTWTRSWMAGDVRAHHIIDPRSGDPACSPIVTASVTARTAAEAEAGAKTVLIAGGDGLAWCDRSPWLRGAAAIWDDGGVYATGSLELAA